MDAAARLHAADMALARLRQMTFKGQRVAAEQRQRAEAEYKQAMKSWLGFSPDADEGAIRAGMNRHLYRDDYKMMACRATLGAACPADKAQGSTTPMTNRPSPQVARDADHFETTLKAARIPDALCDGLWDIWVDNGPRAYSLVARFKDNGQTPAVRYKAAPGMQTVELPAGLAAALTAARAARGDAAIAQLLSQAAPQAAAPAQLRDDQKALKDAALTPAQRVARQTMPELYATPKGTKR